MVHIENRGQIGLDNLEDKGLEWRQICADNLHDKEQRVLTFVDRLHSHRMGIQTAVHFLNPYLHVFF